MKYEVVHIQSSGLISKYESSQPADTSAPVSDTQASDTQASDTQASDTQPAQ